MRTDHGKGARDAVEAAVNGGWTSDEILAAVKGWFAYADTPQGATIQHKGFFTASRLRSLRPPPKVEISREQAARDYIAERYAQVYRRH